MFMTVLLTTLDGRAKIPIANSTNAKKGMSLAIEGIRCSYLHKHGGSQTVDAGGKVKKQTHKSEGQDGGVLTKVIKTKTNMVMHNGNPSYSGD